MELILLLMFFVPLIMVCVGISQLAKAAETWKEAKEQWKKK